MKVETFSSASGEVGLVDAVTIVPGTMLILSLEARAWYWER